MRGVSDTGQLSILLAQVMQAELRDIGAPGAPSDAALAVMRGDGPQTLPDASYTASFRLYPWRSTNPSTHLPEDGRFTWTAPGGSGDHSLPMDFQPATIERLQGRTVISLVGPRAKTGMPVLVRTIGASRMFGGLRAELAEVRRLPAREVAEWMARVDSAVK
jgi:hypothetical protein